MPFRRIKPHIIPILSKPFTVVTSSQELYSFNYLYPEFTLLLFFYLQFFLQTTLLVYIITITCNTNHCIANILLRKREKVGLAMCFSLIVFYLDSLAVNRVPPLLSDCALGLTHVNYPSYGPMGGGTCSR